MEENKEKKKLSYEDLENLCHQLSDQGQKLYRQLQEANMTNVFKRLDYLFAVVDNRDAFPEDFTKKCIDENILDPIKLDKYLMNEDTKAEIRDECGVSPAHFQVIMGKLRKSGVIKDGNINPLFIPNIKEDNGTFQLLLYFQL